MVFWPGVNVSVVLQLVGPLPLLALTPFTVTEETPVLPGPLSVATTLTSRLGVVTVAPLAGETILTVGVGVCENETAGLKAAQRNE